MRASRTISLFSERPQPSQRVSSFVFSIMVHAVVIGIVSFVLMYAPKVNMRAATERYVVRRVDLDSQEQEMAPSGGSGSLYPGPRSSAHAAKANGSEAAPASSKRQIAQLTPALQTLLQPDIPLNQLMLKKTSLPSLLLWSANKAKIKVITPAPPHEPSTADVKPSLDPPNKEIPLAELQVSSTAYVTEVPMPTPARTSPVIVHGPAPTIERVPETTSVIATQPSSAAVMSVSDLSLGQGTVELPPVNESAPGNRAGALASGPSGASLQPGSGDPSSKGARGDAGEGRGEAGRGKGNGGRDQGDAGHGQGDAGRGQGDAAHGQGGAAHGQGNGGKTGSAGAGSAPGGTNSGDGKGSANSGSGAGGQGNDRSEIRISLPKDGRFGVVVAGSTMQEQYPETAGIWSGRMTYSVYLHVGLAKSWILQYSLPRSADASAGGSVRLEAPWPYYIVRPNVAPSSVDADVLMIHGFVNEAGRFEGLAVVFPPGFAQGKTMLDAIQQWQFRPAAQNGQPAKVEVLLVIPQDVD